MNWYFETTNEDSVISTRVRLARNISGIPFKVKMSKEEPTKKQSKLVNLLNN